MKRHSSAIISIKTLDATRPYFERAGGAALIVLSAAGCVAAMHGGWAQLVARPLPSAILVGVGIQMACTGVEWLYRSSPWGFAFLLAVAIDMVTSLYGFGPYIAPELIGRLATPIGVLAPSAAWGILIAVAFGLAWLPMAILIGTE